MFTKRKIGVSVSPDSRPAAHTPQALISDFDRSMPRIYGQQTCRVADVAVNVGAGAVLVALLAGIVLIHGPQAASTAVLMTPLALIADRTHLRYRQVRFL